MLINLIISASFSSIIIRQLMIKMDVQDYEYYEARAKDVKLENITSSQHNADILARIRDDDPDFTKLCVTDHVFLSRRSSDYLPEEGDNLGWLGYIIGRSKLLQELHIIHNPNNVNIDAFCGGVGYNRSIQNLSISIDLGEGFKSLVPFLRNNKSLSDLTFDFENSIELRCARSIAVLLGQQSSLKCLSFEEADLGDEGLLEIAATLSKQPQLEELDLSGNNISMDGCVALGSALEGMRNPKLATLDLGRNDIDDEGLHALVAGLINCHNLTSLNLNENELITGAGLRSLSLYALLQSDRCCLECLFLDGLNIDNDGVGVLVAGLVTLPALQKLDLCSNRISDQGVQAYVDLSKNSFSVSVSVSGLRSLGTLIQRTTSLKSLYLGSNNIDDTGLQGLVDDMTTRSSLTHLDLSYNDSITAVGLRTLSAFFRSDNCCLKKLSLWGIDFGDDGVVALADGLMCNKSLTDVNFRSRGITSRGWSAFSKLLCDTASVNNTYLSNHTLERIGEFFHPNTPSDLWNI